MPRRSAVSLSFSQPEVLAPTPQSGTEGGWKIRSAIRRGRRPQGREGRSRARASLIAGNPGDEHRCRRLPPWCPSQLESGASGSRWVGGRREPAFWPHSIREYFPPSKPTPIERDNEGTGEKCARIPGYPDLLSPPTPAQILRKGKLHKVLSQIK